MQVNISGHHVEVSEALHAYVDKRFDRIDAHFDHITNVQVTLSIQKQFQRAEATLHTRGAEINATAEQDDMYAAIDALVDKLTRQLEKQKGKNLDRQQGVGSPDI